jgi:hypothetical protein
MFAVPRCYTPILWGEIPGRGGVNQDAAKKASFKSRLFLSEDASSFVKFRKAPQQSDGSPVTAAGILAASKTDSSRV